MITAEGSLPASDAAAAVDAVVTSPAVLRELAAALAADPDMLRHGAPPAAGRLAAELIARGSATLALPACARCGRDGMPLYRTPGGGMCKACTARQNTAECAHCGEVKAAAGRDAAGQRICERCRRRDRGHRQCGICGKTASIAVRARDGAPDICVNCYRMPSAVCSVCGKYRECNFAASDHPVCPSCTPRAVARCARCGQDRPPQARWPEGPVCDPCYTAALRHRAPCASCGQLRRLGVPARPGRGRPAPAAPGMPVTCACTELRHRRQALRARQVRTVQPAAPGRGAARRTRRGHPGRAGARARGDLRRPQPEIRAQLAAAAAEAPRSSPRSPRGPCPPPTRRSMPAPAAGQPTSCARSSSAGGVLPPRDEELARTEQWLTALLSDITDPGHRQLVHAFATWHVMRRLRRAAAASRRPRTYTAHARNTIKAAARLLAWLAERGRPCRLPPGRHRRLAGHQPRRRQRPRLPHLGRRPRALPPPRRPPPAAPDGTAITGDQRWELAARLLHDDTIDPSTGPPDAWSCSTASPRAGSPRSPPARSPARRRQDVTIRLGQHDIPVPAPLGELLLTLAAEGKPYAGTGTPRDQKWLFPGQLAGRPITPERLAERLRAIGIPVMAGRRTALTDLAAQMPAAVLADSLGFRPATAVRWRHQAGADWNRYAAELARERNHEPGE